MPAAIATFGRRWGAAAVILLVTAFALRAVQFGNPLLHVDEGFYLLVGDRMLHGALPYVDIWDRKPVGLFLLYSAIRLLGGGGIVQYQVVATLFAAATAFMVSVIATRYAGRVASTSAGIVYLGLLLLMNGAGGQAPVFYNLFTAVAAWATLRATEAGDNRRAIRRFGCIAMAAMGVAIQIKYTVLFEGVFFGIVLLWHGWQADRRLPASAATAAVWIGLALLPTVAACAYFAAVGHFRVFFYANFLSIGDRGGEASFQYAKRLSKAGAVLGGPLLAIAAALMLCPWRRFAGGAAAFRFVACWLAVALLGYGLFGTWFDHYALPLMVPLAAGCAALFGETRHSLGAITATALVMLSVIAGEVKTVKSMRSHGAQAEAARMVAAIQPRLKGRCLFILRGNTILYHLSDSCIPTRYAFPSHLTLAREAPAIGIDPIPELHRILATKPPVIVDQPQDDLPSISSKAINIVRSRYGLDYRLVTVVRTPKPKHDDVWIYERIPGR